MRYLGIDYGSKRVGLALSDENGSMGFPHRILPNTSGLLEELCTLIKKESVGAIVIGDTKDFLGGDNAITAAARTLGVELEEETGLPVYYEPEVLTSAEARRAPQNSDDSRRPKEHAHVDASAAALILTSYLSRSHG